MSESLDSILYEADSLARNADRDGAFSVLRRLPVEDLGLLLLDVPQKYQSLASLLPRMPSEEIQRNWTGNAGSALLAQSLAFVRTLSKGFERYAGRTLSGATILDYGCGWGRLLRLMYAFSPPNKVFGIDPWGESINICQSCGLHGPVAICEYLPRSLPFPGIHFDLIYAFSVFTHLSERTAGLVQRAMRARIAASGIAVITVRPVEYWLHHREVLPQGETINHLMQMHSSSGFAFVPHNRLPIEGEITYGDASVSLSYIEQNWRDWKIEGIERNVMDPHQEIIFLTPSS